MNITNFSRGKLSYSHASLVAGIQESCGRVLSIVRSSSGLPRICFRVFWLITFLLSLGLCCSLIYNVWIKWQESPVIVSFSEKMIPVWQVPFPSFTICPRTKTQTFVYNFTDNYNKFLNGSLEKSYNTSRFLEQLDNVALVCGSGLRDRFTDRDSCDHTSVADLIQVGLEIIIRVAPKVDDVFNKCLWRGEKEKCSDIFKIVVTFHGICYNFNGLASSDIFDDNSIQKEYQYMYTTRPAQGWSPDEGYELRMDDDMYPRRGHQNSALPDLEIELLENAQKQDKLCIGEKRGFKIILHHPMDSPRAKPFYHIQGGQEGALSMSFHMISTSEKLRSYAPHVRQCYFPAERKLRYFKEYTQKNCERECRANYTFARCGCVWFNMAQELTIHEMKLALQAAAGNETKEGCDCLPTCNSVKYEAELLKSPYSKTIVRQFNESSSDFSEDVTQTQLEYEIAKLEVNFKDSQFSSLSRSELFGLTDFMANCGGLLGLFLGFSFLSIIEILYYFTLRDFGIGRNSLHHEEHKGRPVLTVTPDNVARVRKMIRDDKRRMF
ncbi:Pickpocket protein 28 [Eumeta japonica]|uniref:Pickpocket protein 28 n=1 Tax=Eumeta variegata TaxID=151549 RepID=A0A4C1VVK7_EUMVA|nr:Pickpocket protein 28 [Eumeta japonica]